MAIRRSFAEPSFKMERSFAELRAAKAAGGTQLRKLSLFVRPSLDYRPICELIHTPGPEACAYLPHVVIQYFRWDVAADVAQKSRATGLKNPPHLLQRLDRFAEVLECLTADDEIEGIGRKRHVRRVALAKIHVDSLACRVHRCNA